MLPEPLLRNTRPMRPPDRGVIWPLAGRENDTLVMFFHGLFGDHLATWGMTPHHILDNSDFHRVDFCFLGYSTQIRTVDLLGQYIASMVKRAGAGDYPFTRAYRRLVLVAHSLGGVGVRAAVLRLVRDDPETSSRVDHLSPCGASALRRRPSGAGAAAVIRVVDSRGARVAGRRGLA
jgi:hypothetical protein